MSPLNKEGDLALGRTVSGDSFPIRLREFIEQQTEVSRSLPNPSLGRTRNAAALAALGEFVRQLTLDNQTLRILQAGQPHGNAYEAGKSALAVLSHVGLDAPPQTTREVFEEFVAASVDDVIERAKVATGGVVAANQAEQKARERGDKLEARAVKAETKATDLTGENESLRNEVQSLRGQVEFLNAAQAEPVQA